MKRLFCRNPILALAVLAVLLICNYCKERQDYKETSELKVSLDEKRWQICVSKSGERKKHRFDFPEFFAYDHVSLSLQNGEIIIHHGGMFVATIEMICAFDTTSNKLILKNVIGTFPERHDQYGGYDACGITEINRFIDDKDLGGDSLFHRLINGENCQYEYDELPPLQKISEDFAEIDNDGDLYVYRNGDYVKRYKAFFKTYPLSDANQVTYNNIGYYLEQAGSYEAAVYLLSAVLEKYPQRAVAHLNIADAYWGDGKRGKARKHYEKYVGLMKRQGKDMSVIPQSVYDRIMPPPPLTDSRDGQQYRTVEIGKQIWMAENLNYAPTSDNSWCYYDIDDSCTKYGRLYDWNAAMNVCPMGWHLPSVQEWGDLMRAAGSERKQYNKKWGNHIDTFWGWDNAGKLLKAKSGWIDDGNGTDNYGFSALPGGGSDGEYFADIGCGGWWWTANEAEANMAHLRYMTSTDGNVREDTYRKHEGFSVRCVQD